MVKLQGDAPKYVFEIAKELRKKQMSAEAILWEYIRNNKFKGYKFRRQHPFGRYIVDFYCDKAKLAIELDGEIHERDTVKEYDEERQKAIEAASITVLRFKNEDIFNDIEKVLSEIGEVLDKNFKETY